MTAIWTGETLTFTYYFPTYGSVFTGSPISFVADGSPYLSTYTNLNPATFSVSTISPSEMQIHYAYPDQTNVFGLNPTAFNGFTISGSPGDAPISGIFIDGASTVTGLTNANLSFTDNSATVN